jgi:hypothetical protein
MNELGATFEETARILESLALGETPLFLPSRQLTPGYQGEAAEHSPLTEALVTRVPRVSETRASEYQRAGAGQLIFSAGPRPAPQSSPPPRRQPARAEWVATGTPPPRSPSRDFMRLPSPERIADARPGRGEPWADTHHGRTAQKKAQWEARERQLKLRRADATEAVMAHYSAVSYSGAIFAQLHSLLDAAYTETGRQTPLPPLRQMDKSETIPTTLPRVSMIRSRPASAAPYISPRT